MKAAVLGALAALLCPWSGLAAQAEVAPATGRIAGQVIDRETGRPISGARVIVLPSGAAVQTDLDGRYRTPALAVGRYSVRVALIGFSPAQVDSVLVEDGRSTDVGFALTPLPVQMSAVVIEAAPTPKPSSDAGLLAVQQAAAAVTDGVSAQSIARAPDNNAGEAVKRVTGVSIYDGKFLVCRGLGERYSTALLNGAEMPNPVVEKKVAPLDLFPAGLIASIVAAKTATPDMPGDFAGCSVNLVTKDFPDARLLQFSVSTASNTNAAFQYVPLPPRSGTDWLAIDDGRRQPPPIPYGNLPVAEQTKVLQGFGDDLWNPAPRHTLPQTGFAGTYGNQWQGTGHTVGTVFSLAYNPRVYFSPNRIHNVYYLTQEALSTIDWGGVANLSYRFGVGNKLSWRNLYSRSADETSQSGQGATGSTVSEQYLLRYVERYLWQTQLTGEHRVFGSTLQWRGAYTRASIDDPDNHVATYTTAIEQGAAPAVSATRTWRTLDDITRSGQLDWSFPVSLRRQADALVKVGGYYRATTRDYDGRDLNIYRNAVTAPASGVDGVIESMPPEQALALENMGSYFTYSAAFTHNDPFFADDNVGAAYAMLDIPVLSSVRLVGGVRAENWDLTLKPGGNDPEGNWLKYGEDSVIHKNHLDPLWSANLTFAASERMNVRLAAYRTVARPDSREISPGSYTPFAGFAACTEVGNPDLDRTLITNGDARWEFYPRPGEVLAISGFYKHFVSPIVELRTTGGFDNPNVNCPVANAQSAEVLGGEFEVRRLLDFLPGMLGRFGVGVNLTVVSSSIQFQPDQGVDSRQFIGQSPLVVNSYLSYEPPGSWLQGSLLYNYFGDRLTKYSNKQDPNAAPYPNPNWVEQGRGTLDAKLRIALGVRMGLSVSARNLTNSPVVIVEDSPPSRTVEHYNLGISLTTTLNYAF